MLQWRTEMQQHPWKLVQDPTPPFLKANPPSPTSLKSKANYSKLVKIHNYACTSTYKAKNTKAQQNIYALFYNLYPSTLQIQVPIIKRFYSQAKKGANQYHFSTVLLNHPNITPIRSERLKIYINRNYDLTEFHRHLRKL